MGEAVLHGDNAVFNITPSPGASTSLGNARRDAKQVASWLDADFDDEAFLADHVRNDTKQQMDNDLATELFEP
jgi:malate dehydrogenase (quinone)